MTAGSRGAADATRIALIVRARQAGATWAQIGAMTGAPGPKAAKAAAKRLARRVNEAMIRARAQGGEDG